MARSHPHVRPATTTTAPPSSTACGPVLRPGGRYFMLCFSDQQPGEWGRVHKVTRDEITASFADGWQVDSIEPSTIDITSDLHGIRAWLVALTRI